MRIEEGGKGKSSQRQESVVSGHEADVDQNAVITRLLHDIKGKMYIGDITDTEDL